MTNSDHKITTCLWFDDQAGEAAKFYTSLFSNSRIGEKTSYGKEGQDIHGKPEGAEMTVSFELEGEKFTGLNGGPHFQFNPSISIFVGASENEINTLWNALERGGKVMMPLDKYEWSEKYGWLQDKFGLSWQLMLDKDSSMEQKICPLLFFTGDRRGQAEEAVNFYTSLFKNSRIVGIQHYSEEESEYAKDTVKHSQFKLMGQTFMAMDSGTENNYPFNEAISFVVPCETQEEIDYYWDHLSEEGDPRAQQCGWLKDKFGVSWQITPNILHKFLSSGNQTRAGRVTKAFLQMKKFDIKKLREAYD